MKKVGRGPSDRNDKSLAADGLEKQLKEVNQLLNHFLKNYFTIDIHSIQHYLTHVKNLLIELTTTTCSPLITNVFSKFSNILQPFTSYSFDLSLDSHQHQLQQLQQENLKMSRRNVRLKAELEEYRVKSSKSMDFIYMLRRNNINVDQLFKKGLPSAKIYANLSEQEQLNIVRAKAQMGEGLFQGIGDSKLTSQYVSTKSRHP